MDRSQDAGEHSNLLPIVLRRPPSRAPVSSFVNSSVRCGATATALVERNRSEPHSTPPVISAHDGCRFRDAFLVALRRPSHFGLQPDALRKLADFLIFGQ